MKWEWDLRLNEINIGTSRELIWDEYKKKIEKEDLVKTFHIDNK